MGVGVGVSVDMMGMSIDPPPGLHRQSRVRQCLLAPGELPALRAAGLQVGKEVLYQHARELYKTIASGESMGEIKGDDINGSDLTTQWINWREYIALHERSVEIVANGIAAVTAQRDKHLADFKRDGFRVFFVIHRSLGGKFRLHPTKEYLRPMASDGPVLQSTLTEI